MATNFKCAFCNGSGKDPFNLLSELSDCQVCNGSGKVEIQEPCKKCPFCSGTGKNPLGPRVTCIVCGGKGKVYNPGTEICPSCGGLGKSPNGLPCSRCNGIGTYTPR